MPVLTIRNVPDEVHRALRARAAQHGCSAEAEVRAILRAALIPAERVLMGDALAALGRELGITDEDVDALEATGTSLPPQPSPVSPSPQGTPPTSTSPVWI